MHHTAFSLLMNGCPRGPDSDRRGRGEGPGGTIALGSLSGLYGFRQTVPV